MNGDFKKEAEEWAEKILSDSNVKQESYEQLIELMTLGSLVYKEDENGNRV